jgi:glycosyltransferase involved in cell wall biosynthesis
MKVSVVIPCYNSSAYLRETLESVFAQTLRDFEIVLVDDGSTDGTQGLIERLAAENPGGTLRFVFQANTGVAGARNRGISMARGRYILPLDADDLIAPTMLESCAAVLDAEPDITLVYTDREEFGDVEATWKAGQYDLARLKYFNQMSYCSMYRRAMWEALGGYRLNVNGFDDWDFWIAAAARGMRGRHVPGALLKHRKRKDSQMLQIVNGYEALFAKIILNNRETYSAHEVKAAEALVSTGEVAPFLRSAKFIFMGHFLGRFTP